MNNKIEIYDELSNKEIEMALTSTDIKMLWEVFSSLEGKGNEEFDIAFYQVKNGINIPFDIGSIIDGFVEMFPANQLVKIERKIQANLIDYRNEIRARKQIMKDVLRSIYDGDFDNQSEINIKGYNNERYYNDEA